MTSQEELEQKVRESGSLVERLESCRARIGKMCSEGRPPKMTIPVHWDDDDFFISVTIKDAQQCVQLTADHGADFWNALAQMKTETLKETLARLGGS